MESRDWSGAPAALKEKVCLVTRGAQGIGLAVTRALARQGAHVHIAAISPESMESAAAELEAAPLGASVTFHLVDASDRDAFEKCVAQVHAVGGRLDILVNKAAFTQWRDVADMSVEDAERTMRTSYDAMVYGVKAALPLMRAAGSGHIVNMGSATGVVFVKGPSAAYTAVKAAINAYTQILTGELAATAVHVTLVRPGTVGGTEFFGTRVPSSRVPRLADFLPVSTPEQVADAIVSGILRRRAIVDTPGYLPWMYRAYALAPRLLTRLASLGGPARSDFAVTRPTAPAAHKPAQAGNTSSGARAKRLVLRLMDKASPTVWISAAGRLFLVPVDTMVQFHSAGRLSVGRGLGVPSLLLTSTGALSGQPRQAPLSTSPTGTATASWDPTSDSPTTPPGPPTSCAIRTLSSPRRGSASPSPPAWSKERSGKRSGVSSSPLLGLPDLQRP